MPAASEGGALELAARRRLGHFLPLPSLQEPAAPAPAAGEGKKGSAEYIQSPASTAPAPLDAISMTGKG